MGTFAVEDILLCSILPVDVVELETEILAFVLWVGDAHDGWRVGGVRVGADCGDYGVFVEFGFEEWPDACDYANRHFVWCKE